MASASLLAKHHSLGAEGKMFIFNHNEHNIERNHTLSNNVCINFLLIDHFDIMISIMQWY